MVLEYSSMKINLADSAMGENSSPQKIA